MARISDRQWRDAFRAAGYAGAEQQRFITKLKSKIGEGLALARTVRYEPVISFNKPKNARLRAELIPQLTGTLW
jgi:hypothetical protein